MEFFLYLLQVIVISLSGVMAPGPVAAATLVAGTRSRHAGALVAVGHGIVELPLMILLVAGLSQLLTTTPVKIIIGLAGGVFLAFLALQMFRDAGKPLTTESRYAGQNPIRIGIILSIGNPYFLIWWATIGLKLLQNSRPWGLLALALFALVHWLCDLTWLELLSQASHKGAQLLGPRLQKTILIICALALTLFAAMFMYDAVHTMISPPTPNYQPPTETAAHFTINDVPVISAGFSSPIISNAVGITSANRPSPRSFTPL